MLPRTKPHWEEREQDEKDRRTNCCNVTVYEQSK